MFDAGLISRFREKVNEGFVLNHYRNGNRISKWNCICSAMDWISVSVDYLSEEWHFHKNMNIECIHVYTYISCVDILWEAICQLHRVFWDTTDIPFKGESECFSDKIVESDDNTYFKTIRSCFGAHPVNLNDPFQKLGAKEKRYASWPFKNVTKNTFDYEVWIYSNEYDASDAKIGLRISEIRRFAERRYGYLSEVMQKIDLLEKDMNKKQQK